MSLQFQYPWLLFLLWLIPLAGLLWHLLTRRRTGHGAFVSATMAARLAPPWSPVRRHWQLALLMTGLALALIAAARPQWGMREETVYQRGRDLLLVLDVSRSMLARDVHPSRLGRAKADLQDLVRQMRGDRVGLLAFRGRPVLLCPLTTDYGFLSQTLEGADVDSAPAGETDIGDAVLEGLQSLKDDAGSHKAIVLVSDGDDLAGKVGEAIAQAKEQGVAVFTVGFGSTDGAPIPSATDRKANMSYQGHEVVSKLNHGVLRDLAEQTGGAYVPVGQANVKLGDLYRDHLSRIASRDLEESVQRRYVERYQWFLFPAVLCFLAIAFLSRGQIFTRPRPPSSPDKAASRARAGQTVLLLVAAGLGSSAATLSLQAEDLPLATNAIPAPSPAAERPAVPEGREGARLAQQLYLQGKYEQSAEAYRSAAGSAARANRDAYLYNAGCALLKSGKMEEAADAFRELSGDDSELATSAAFNQGYALFASGNQPVGKAAATPPDPALAEHHAQLIRQATTAYQKALRLKPDDAQALKSLAVAATATTEAEEQAKIIRLMAEHGQSPPGKLADAMLLQQRQLLRDLPGAFTNTSPSLITTLEGLALTEEQTADLMIPLKGKLLQAMAQGSGSGNQTNAQQQIAMVNAFAEAIRDELSGVTAALRDLDRSAYGTATRAEGSIYTLWKGIAGYEALLREDIERQTNAIIETVAAPAPAEAGVIASVSNAQAEATLLTMLFKERFDQTVPKEGITRPAPQTSTNNTTQGTNAVEVVLSKEDRAKIITLAGEAITVQQSAVKSLAPRLDHSLPDQHRAHALLKEIEKLLPKEKSPQNSQPQQQPKQQQQEKQQPQNQPNNQPKEQPKAQPKPEPQKGQMSQDDVKKLLEKARQREQEHEQEKRERETTFPMSPAERDW